MQTLQVRLKELRRDKTPRGSKKTADTPKPWVAGKKSPGINRPLSSPRIPAGEDGTSHERHNKALKNEWMKRRPNQVIVNELMEQSFAMRWVDLHSHEYDLDTIFGTYPFLQNSNQVCTLNSLFCMVGGVYK